MSGIMEAIAHPIHVVCFPIQGKPFRLVRRKHEWHGPENQEDSHPPAEFWPDFKTLFKRPLNDEEKPWGFAKQLDEQTDKYALEYDAAVIAALKAERNKRQSWSFFYTAIINDIPLREPGNENTNIRGLYGNCYVQKTYENAEGRATIMLDITEEDMQFVSQLVAEMQLHLFDREQAVKQRQLERVMAEAACRNRPYFMTMLMDHISAGCLKCYANKYVPSDTAMFQDLNRIYQSVPELREASAQQV